jgi:HNH endonuclease
MALSDLTDPSAVLQAIAEFDALGRDAFLQRYGFGPARRFYLSHQGRLYDSKAIVGAAHGFQHPADGSLRAVDFSGGEATVRRKLESLGFTVEVTDAPETRPRSDALPDLEQTVQAELEDSGSFSPSDVTDARLKIMAAIVQRRGQRAFREALMRAYGGRCAITGCSIGEILEAAHIYPYRGDATNHVTNGLLLRSDLHTLFDCGLIAIDEAEEVLIAEELGGSEYERYRGTRLQLPDNPSSRPSGDALRQHREQSGL